MAYGKKGNGFQFSKGRNTSTGTGDTLLKAAPGALGSGIKLWISSVTISNSSGLDTEVHLKSGANIIWTFPAPSGDGATVGRVGGVTHHFPDPIDCEVGDALNFASTTGVSTITVSFAGFQSGDVNLYGQ